MNRFDAERPHLDALRPLAIVGRGMEEKTRVLAVDDYPLTTRYVRDVSSDARYVPLVTGDPERGSRASSARSPRPRTGSS